MIDKEIHWDLLRRPLLIFVVCVAVSASLVYYSSHRYGEVVDDFRLEQRLLQKFARNYRTAIQEEKLYKTYVDQFEVFSEHGYIGSERRLIWIEALQAINQRLKLPVLKYEIKPRQSFALRNADFVISDRITVYESVMKLELGLLHAGDLYTFFDDLTQQAGGLFEVRGCDIRLASSELQFDAEHPNLEAHCLLTWYTLDVAADSELLAEQ